MDISSEKIFRRAGIPVNITQTPPVNLLPRAAPKNVSLAVEIWHRRDVTN
jgi:hypothetical protein